MLFGRRRIFRACTYGSLLTLVFLVFIMMQMFVSSDHTNMHVHTDTHEHQDGGGDGRRILNVDTDYIDAVLKYESKDKRLITFVAKKLTKSNNDNSQSYILDHPTMKDFSRGQSKVIDEYFKQKKDGSFLDIGASDGEKASVSLFFERERGYTGLLVEPNPERFHKILKKRKNSLVLNSCVQTETSGYSLKFDFNSSNQDVACFKLETILAAAGRKKYDILSINKKDNEYAILKSIPFSDFQFEVISIEFDTDFLSGQHKVEELLQSHNYTGWQQFTHHPFKKRDLVFVRKQ